MMQEATSTDPKAIGKFIHKEKNTLKPFALYKLANDCLTV